MLYDLLAHIIKHMRETLPNIESLYLINPRYTSRERICALITQGKNWRARQRDIKYGSLYVQHCGDTSGCVDCLEDVSGLGYSRAIN